MCNLIFRGELQISCHFHVDLLIVQHVLKLVFHMFCID